MDIMLYAIPVFFILIGLELLVAKMHQTELYRVNDAVANISCGISQQVTEVFFKIITLGLYIFCYEQWRVMDIPNNWATYIILFILVDCLYYWFHRYSHEISTLWGAHIVHHQSEEYNLSVALRQSAFQGIFSSVFYVPLAILGFDPIVFAVIKTFQTLYQFWIHTEVIRKMPSWFEYIFNTPSHHRVHHGRNPKYIDKNHGGTLIIFDRLFGTFQEEDEPVVYGVTKPLASWNPLWANFDYYKDLGKNMAKAPTLWNKIQMLFHKPGWRPESMGGAELPPPITRDEQHKYHTIVPASLNWYVLLHYVLILLGTTGFLMYSGDKNPYGLDVIILVSLILLAVLSLGGILDKKNWIWITEFLRLVGIPIALWLLFGNVVSWMMYAVLGLGGLALISFVWLFPYRNIFKV